MYDSSWIPRIHQFHPITPPRQGSEELLVCDLIDEVDNWDVVKLGSLSWEDVRSICSIPICKTADWIHGFDILLRMVFSQQRMLTNVFTNLNGTSPSSSMNGSLNWWKSLWSMIIPNKVKLMVWKIFHNILPTKYNLNWRHIIEGIEFSTEASNHHVPKIFFLKNIKYREQRTWINNE